MRCVNPPLHAKPSRGYGWTCAPCSRRHEEEVDSRGVRHATPNDKKPPKSNAPAPRGRGRPRKDRTLAEKEESLPVKYFKMWPFRYFGCVWSPSYNCTIVDFAFGSQYTVAEDTLGKPIQSSIEFGLISSCSIQTLKTTSSREPPPVSVQSISPIIRRMAARIPVLVGHFHSSCSIRFHISDRRRTRRRQDNRSFECCERLYTSRK